MSLTQQLPRVLIVAEHASAQFGGEAILPLHYFRFLRRLGCEVWMVVHERTKSELTQVLGADCARVSFVSDTWFHKLMHRLGAFLPSRVAYATTGLLSRLSSQIVARDMARALVRRHRIAVVHQPIPVSPREPSVMCGVGAPVVIGPMNGGMTYPPAFRNLERPLTHTFVRFGRVLSDVVNRMLPGKLRAALLLVTNDRTRASLPKGIRGAVREMTENGVDLSVWAPVTQNRSAEAVRFAFVGRLVDWKALDIVLDALARVVRRSALDITLDVLGDGPCRVSWEEQALKLGVSDRVRFHGWKAQSECAAWLGHAGALLLPSLYECGGAVVLEAMAMGLPVIASKWGGPADYLDPSCGILIEPVSREAMVAGFAAGMEQLAQSSELRWQLGQAGRRKAKAKYDWDLKARQMISYYLAVANPV